jgi:hypothetical protein
MKLSFARFGRRPAEVKPEPGPEISSAPAETAKAGADEPKPAIETAATAEPAVAKAEAAPAEPRTAARLVEKAKPFERRLREAVTAATRSAAAHRKPVGVAAALVLSAGLGYASAIGASSRNEDETVATARWLEAASGLRGAQEELARLSGEMKSAKLSLDALKGERERARSDGLGRQTQALERLERQGGELGGKVAKLAEQVDRIEKTQRDPARLQVVFERLDRIEKQIQVAAAPPTPPPAPVAAAPAASPSVAPTPPAKPVAMHAPADVAQTGSIETRPAKPAAETDPRKTQLDGYVLRDIDEGYALIEMKNGRFVEVTAGQIVPGAGRVEGIERRGRQWVVVTAKGFIGER